MATYSFFALIPSLIYSIIIILIGLLIMKSSGLFQVFKPQEISVNHQALMDNIAKLIKVIGILIIIYGVMAILSLFLNLWPLFYKFH